MTCFKSRIDFAFCAFVSVMVCVNSKPGECPNPLKGLQDECTEKCSSDDFCPGYEKCCSRGCGKSCRSPVNLTCPELNCDESLDCTRDGYKLDEFGCATCECYVSPCPMFRCIPCESYYNYSMDIVPGTACRACECVSSVNCPPLPCQCPHGYKPGTDINGCPTCRCEPVELVCRARPYRGSVIPVLDSVPPGGCPPMSSYDVAENDQERQICCEASIPSSSDKPVCDDGGTNYNGSCGLVFPPQSCTVDQYCSVHEVDGWAVCCPKSADLKCPMDNPELSIADAVPVLNHVPESGCPPMSRHIKATDGTTDVCCRVNRASASDKAVCNDGKVDYSGYCGRGSRTPECSSNWYCSTHEADGWAVCCPKKCPMDIPELSISNEKPLLPTGPDNSCPPMSRSTRATDGNSYLCCAVNRASASDKPVCKSGSTTFNGTCGRVLPPRSCTNKEYCSVHELDGWSVCCPKSSELKCPIDNRRLYITSEIPVLNYVPSNGCPLMSRRALTPDGTAEVCCRVSHPTASEQPVCMDGSTQYSTEREHTCHYGFNCPYGWYCSIHEVDWWFVCCPPSSSKKVVYDITVLAFASKLLVLFFQW